jgi:hypothetical protein
LKKGLKINALTGNICINSLNSVPAVVRVALLTYSGEEEMWRAGKG